VTSIQKVKGHIIVWDLVVPPDTHKNRYIPYSNTFIYLFSIYIICQKVVCTQTKISVFIIRPVSNMSQVYIYQTVWEILTLGKRNKIEKRYINVLLTDIN
jgi:hypothetical protein